jgi:hypothetical protein
MKNLKNIILGLIAALAIVSCDIPVGLGAKLDLSGPEVNFTYPAPRKAVTATFMLKGNISDNSGVKQLLIKVEKDRTPFPRQWRNKGGKWEVSDNFGSSWSAFTQATWEGVNFVNWSIKVDMTINGNDPEEGQYMFIAQAWDSGEMSDDKSFKTLIIIIDNDSPSVSINKPLLYDRYIDYNKNTDKFDVTDDDGKELENLRKLSDWRDPEVIGKFQTNAFDMQWSIEDNFNIWSFDLRFYKMDVEIDEDKTSPLPDDYIYRVYQNSQPVPENPPPELYVKPNGTVRVPALNGTPFNSGNAELKNPLDGANTTIRVVAACYDAAGHPTEEKTIGYFIYWADADIPWITFSGDIKTPEYYNTNPTGSFSTNLLNRNPAFMVYPNVAIKAIAFHAQGIQKVTYSLYRLEEPIRTTYDATDKTLLADYTDVVIPNQISSRGKFDWELMPVPRSAHYVLKATTLSTSGKECEPVWALFKVQDITFPDFPKPVQPPALEPLFQFISSDSITISGVVADATEIDTLCLVWINPQSKGAAANAQLEYFRDVNYQGWQDALTCVKGGAYKEEGYFDSTNKNKVWNLIVTKSNDYPNGINPDTQRVEYKFSRTIPLSDLNIGVGKQPLKSQVFLLRAANKNPKVTVITYTPQGDESPPVIGITNAVISTTTLIPGEFDKEIEQFKGGETITINGTWDEGSVKYLPFDNYLKDNFNITINGTKLTNLTFTGNVPGSNNGTWKAVVAVKDNGPFTANDVPLANLKDTMVISATLTDIGGNVSEDGASWLIKSDHLRLVRISSEAADQTYSSGNIDIFLEFNKPVLLKTGRSANPVLTLKVGAGTATATYETSLNPVQSTRQYFRYTIASGQNAADPNWLDVSGLNNAPTGTTYWTGNNYPFTWVAGEEEIRITKEAQPAHPDGATGTSNGLTYYLRRIPMPTNSTDSMYTLAKGKNIGIDTTAPTVQSINSSSKEGHYALGSEIIINVVFSEPVKISSTLPQLNLQVYKYNVSTNTVTATSVTTNGNVKVNDRTVTFSYTVSATDTTGDKKVVVTGFTGGSITDIAGNTMAAMNLTEANRTLNGGSANNGSGIFINTIPPAVPVFRALTANNNNNASIISNTINNTPVTGESATANDKDLKNYYGAALYFAINGNTNTINTGISATGNERLGALEYSLDALSVDPPVNWKRIDSASATGTPFEQSIYGKYAVRVRQIDKAGNASAASKAVSLNWDPGTLVSRIDSSSANGTYTNNSSRSDTVNVTVYFRKRLTITGTPKITLNAIRGTNTVITVDGAAASNADSLSFTYAVQNTDNTPALTGRDQYLDVTDLSITARDATAAADGVVVTDFIKVPTDNDNKLKYRKDILVQTGALTLSSGPTYNFTSANDVATGTITLTFNRSIIKNTGTVTVTQQDANYRLPAVLTEAQATRYKDVTGFDTYYKKGTNGFSGTAPDTSTKYVLNYTETTVVTPSSTGTGIARFAYDFRAAESVSLPMTSQDITVSSANDKQLVITVTGSNALQVLGATYNFAVPVGIVQDSLGFQWPTSAQSYTGTNGITTTGINRPFVRIDKKISEDRITSETASATMPHLLANFDRLLQTRARLDCRTPNSVVRYNATGQAYEATGATTSYNRNGQNWRNGDSLALATLNEADRFDYLTQPALVETGTTGTSYDSFTGNTTGTGNVTHITVGTNSENGYIWRVSVRSRNSATGNTNSALYEEIAFRTVLTYQLDNLQSNTVGQNLSQGDQLWIRGGDAISSSSIPGFPLTWSDDYNAVRNENRRAGVRLLRRVSATTNVNTTSVWRYITWEINVRTWHDVVLARGTGANTAAQPVNDAWQFGPVQWAYPRGGWVALKDDYTLYPGKHRWMRISNDGSYQPGGTVNYSLEWNRRIAPGANTVTQPPAP